MKPAPGSYRLSTPGPSGGTLVLDVNLTQTGGVGAFGELFAWTTVDGEDVLVSQTRQLTLEFVAGGQGVAVCGIPPSPTVFAWALRS